MLGTVSRIRMHPDEVPVDTDLVRRLLKAQAPQWAALPLAPVASAGTDNSLYRLGDDMVVRLPRIAWAAPLVEKEWTWLPKLGPHLPLSVPRPLFMGEPGEAYPWQWSVGSWLEGEEASVEKLKDPAQAAVSAAEFLLALQRQDAAGGPQAGPANFDRGVPLKQRDAKTRAALASLQGRLDTAPLAAAWQRALAAAEHSGPPRWLHGDLRPGNLLSRGGELSAVIDFGCLGVGDPACDLQCAWSFFPAGVRDVFRRAVGADDGAWERGRGWALSVSIIALPYYWNTNQDLRDISLHTIREVVAQ